MSDLPKTIVVDLVPILPGGENGGAKIFVLELLNRLAELAPETQFILLTHEKSHHELLSLESKNIKCMMIVRNPAKSSFWYLIINKATVLLGQLGIHVYSRRNQKAGQKLLQNMKANLLFCPFTAPTYYEPGIPTVCTIYDLQYKTYPEFFAAEDVAHRDFSFTEACRRASGLAAISEYSRQSAIRHGGLNPECIRTIHLQMAQRIKCEKNEDYSVLNRLGLKSQHYLLYPANFWKHKNHEMLITAFGIACNEGLSETIKLVCTGAPGEREKWLVKASQAMNLSDRVLFPGYLLDSELAVLMSQSAGLFFPSLYEGFGLPVIEAMVAGVPVACSNRTSLPEVVGDAAILFDPRIPNDMAKAMINLVKDKELRERLIDLGKEQANKFFDTNRMALEYLELFKQAIKERKEESILTGSFRDGWLGPCINLYIAPNKDNDIFEMELTAPEWLPNPTIKVQTIHSGKTHNEKPLEILRGQKAVLILPISSDGGYYEIRVSPTFVPADAGHNDDQRELSLMVQKCGVTRKNGEFVGLV